MALIDVEMIAVLFGYIAFACVVPQLGNSARHRWEDATLSTQRSEGSGDSKGTTEHAKSQSKASIVEKSRKLHASMALDDYHDAVALFFCADRWFITIGIAWVLALVTDIWVAAAAQGSLLIHGDDLWRSLLSWCQGRGWPASYRLPWVVVFVVLIIATDRMFLKAYRNELILMNEYPVHKSYWFKPRRKPLPQTKAEEGLDAPTESGGRTTLEQNSSEFPLKDSKPPLAGG